MSIQSPNHRRVACRLSIRGVVQGVGFRPFVYRAAARHRVTGWVLNGESGVEIHAEASAEDIDGFVAELRSGAPPAARIGQFDVVPTTAEDFSEFEIRISRRDAPPTVRIAPDLAICADCLRELSDPGDRRHRYPYINCTNCGPRYSIIGSLPYDRANTTMAGWELCEDCRSEFQDPLDRRYHAQPIACQKCGPGYQLIQHNECLDSGPAAIRRAAELLRAGSILAVKGIGGFHLACDASNAATVAELRTRKYRKEKPFAVMVRSLDDARKLVELTAAHEALLIDVARPIVLAQAKAALPEVAPDNDSLGVMLPYAPLHHLLFGCGAPCPLVLTSANRSSEPIAYRDEDALARLTSIADGFLLGERPIARRVDDSVVAVRGGQPFMIRRSRGYAPAAVCQFPADEPILALGGDLKNSITLVVSGQAFVSQHIGDLGDHETDLAFEETVRDLLAMYELKPEDVTVAHDLHPQFKSTRFAQSLPARRHVAVQHHHAHVASVLAEQGLFDERAVGLAWDGTGYGTDGSIWGGESFVGSIQSGFDRCAALRAVQMPGGDAAARFPVQAAAGFLAELTDLPDMNGPPFCFPQRFNRALALVDKNVRCFASTSMGRLFDAVAALLGFTRETTFEGQAAIWLEHLAGRCPPQAAYPFPNLDYQPLLRAVLADRMAGRDDGEIAAAFHSALAAGAATEIRRLSLEHDISIAALSGGVFQNELLLSSIVEQIQQFSDLRLLTNRQVPVNDGGVSLGQAALAAIVGNTNSG